ncbi:MAG TPA: TIGR03621 family F420-dependent LLM class oxidoreductase [Acidimicrobiales bacterium]|nr:TIGR03621 family F420-dependent LLM class oxidoreductase [Acidimicrobiales bacterium]
MAHHPFRFGIQLANAADGPAWAALARKAEDLGYSSLLMPDHFGDQLAPVPALVAAAAATTELKVGALVWDNDYKHPVVLAKEAATIDVLSGGRLEFGIGAGWMRSDYDGAGMPYDPPGVRISRMEEAITIIKGLLAGETVTFTGEHYRVDAMEGTPRPVQQPGPPIIIGGGGKRVLSIAGREADIVGINVNLAAGEIGPDAGPNATAEATAQKVAWVRDAAGDRFDEIELNVLVFLAIVTDDREGTAAAMAGGFNIRPDQALQVPHALVGNVDEICEDLRQRRDDHGLSYITFNEGAFEAMAPVVARLAGT